MRYKIIKYAIIGIIGIGIFSVMLLPDADPADTQVRTEQIHALRPHPQSSPDNTVRVEPGIVSIADNAKVEYAGGNSSAFSSVSSGNSRIDLVVLNSSGALEIVAGTQDPSPVPPTYPSDKMAIAEVTITETGTPVINDADIKDVRFFLNLGGGGGTAHNILSATHGDSTAGSVARGDLIVGDSNPKWVRKAKGSAGQLVTFDANDIAYTTATYPATTTVNQILYSSGANVVAGISTGDSGVLVTNGSGVPSIGTDIPTAVTIGSGYVYRAGGTDVAVADGGTGTSTGSITGTGALTFTASGSNQNITLTPSGTGYVNVHGAGSDSATYTSLRLDNTAAASVGTRNGLLFYWDSKEAARIAAVIEATSPWNTGLGLFTATNAGLATEKMRITNDGKIGIGTTVPDEQLHVMGNLKLNNTRAELYASDRNHMIVVRGLQDGTVEDSISYYEYGGTLNAGKGHRFFTGGAIASQTEKMRISNDGIYMLNSLGIGTTGPTAYLHLKAGTNTASTAPLKFTSGTNLTAAEAGAVEWNGTNLFITQTSGPTRKTIAYTTDIAYPGAGIANSTGSAWGTSYTTTGSGTVVALGTSPALTTPTVATSIVGDATFAAFNTVSTTLNAFGAATALTIGGTPTAAVTHNYSTNATATGNTKTVNLGTGGAAGSTTNVNIGSSVAGTTTVNSPTLALGTGSLTMTGSIGATGARAAKLWTTDLEMTNLPSVGGVALTTTVAKLNYLTSATGTTGTNTTNIVFSTSPVLTTPSIGAATASGLSLTSSNTTQTTTSSAVAINVNSLTTGTGLYAASSSLSSGSLIDLAITGTAGLTNQKGINISLSGANGTGAQTTYGTYISNTHTGTSNNVGLYATASGGSNNYSAIFDGGNVGIGTTDPGSYKLYVNGTSYFNGQLTVTNLNKLAGSFQIDHPLDPANKVLRHSFVESPDMKNIYDGVAILDGKGECAVELPGYFSALNDGFRYQLTPIGRPGMLYVKEEIKDNKFSIGGEPGTKVSWQVTGIRKDAYADKHRIVVEEEKGKEGLPEKGEYLAEDCYEKK